MKNRRFPGGFIEKSEGLFPVGCERRVAATFMPARMPSGA
jgi:hypothetical protein